MALGTLTAALQHLHSGHRGDESKLFAAVHHRNSKDDRHKSKHEGFSPDIRRRFSPQGEPGSGKGCSERLPPWRFSSHNLAKP